MNTNRFHFFSLHVKTCGIPRACDQASLQYKMDPQSLALRPVIGCRFGSLADVRTAKVMSAFPRERTCTVQLEMSAMGQKRTFARGDCDVRQALEPDIRRSRHATLHTNLSARSRNQAAWNFSQSIDALYQGLPTMPPVVADGHHGTQIKSGHGSNGIEPALAFDANRLKGE